MMKFQRVDDKSFYKEHVPVLWVTFGLACLGAAGLYFLSQGAFAWFGMWGPSATIICGILAIVGFLAAPLGVAVHGYDARNYDSKISTAKLAAETLSQRYGGEFTHETVRALLGKKDIYTLTDGLSEEEAKEDWYGPLVPVTFDNIARNVRLANRNGQWILVDVTGLPNDRLWDAPEAELSRTHAL